MTEKVHLTQQRRAIYEIVKESHDHPTAAEVMERLRVSGFQFAYATVYNSLRYLADAGLIRELKLGGAASRYDGHIQEHYHIRCSVCGKVDEVMSELPPTWLEEAVAKTGYLLQDHQVMLTGVCPTCRKTPKQG